MRTVVITLRVTPAEEQMLTQLADADGVYKSDVIRLLVRREHESRFPAQPPKKKRTK